MQSTNEFRKKRIFNLKKKNDAILEQKIYKCINQI